MRCFNNLTVTSVGRYTVLILRNPYRWNPVDTVVRNRVTLAIVLSRTMQAAFGTSRAISKLRRRRNTRASIAQCIVVTSCRGEINVRAALREPQAIREKKRKTKERRKMRWPFGRELADHGVHCVCPRVAALVPRIG